MQRTIKYLAYLLFTAVFFTSCGNDVSLQRYYVDNQESKNFISQDIPLSVLKIDTSNFSKAQNEAYESVNKLNFLGYKTNDTDADSFKTELAKVNTILSHSKYNDLMVFSDNGNKISVTYIGTENEADEIVLFGSAKDMGFGIVRILGDNMSPDKMVTLITALENTNIGDDQVEKIMNFFK